MFAVSNIREKDVCSLKSLNYRVANITGLNVLSNSHRFSLVEILVAVSVSMYILSVFCISGWTRPWPIFPVHSKSPICTLTFSDFGHHRMIAKVNTVVDLGGGGGVRGLIAVLLVYACLEK